MTREDIEQLNVLVPYCFETDLEEKWYNIGLKHGLEIADEHPKNVWHDANEKPHAKKWLLVQLDKDDYKILSLEDSHIDSWCDLCKILNFIRWAYIEDLLPK